ncbi:MAG: hypothetical protein ACPIOQ_40755, partial [Promethearchaeia archaeon]
MAVKKRLTDWRQIPGYCSRGTAAYCIPAHTRSETRAEEVLSSGTGVQRVGAMASLVVALLCASLVPSAAFRAGPLALQWRPGACLDLKARQTVGSIPPLRCPLLSTAMSETSTDVGDVDQREWEQWTAKFAGKFVLRSGTATGTSRRAAIQTSGFMLCHHVIAARASPALSSGLVHRGARALICL